MEHVKKKFLEQKKEILYSVNKTMMECKSLDNKPSRDRKTVGRFHTKLERLALTFADGAIKEVPYKTNLEKLKKQEMDLLRRQQGIDPSILM
jgi:Fe-S cluster assembly scaffold protein SufB